MSYKRPENLFEAESLVELIACDASMEPEDIPEVAESISPGNELVYEIIQELRDNYWISEDVLSYYAKRLLRACKK